MKLNASWVWLARHLADVLTVGLLVYVVVVVTLLYVTTA